jgi:hypothetical protein
MDSKALKRFIKQAVKEAIQEELKDILLEAVRSPKLTLESTSANTGGYGVPNMMTETVLHRQNTSAPKPNTREMYASLLNGMMENRNGNLSMTSTDALAFGANQEYRPPVSANTTAEGSSLPSGEVNLNQIMGLMNKK